MVRRTIIAACILLFLVLVLAALWTLFDWPPPRLILKYGFPPAGGPTGRRMTIEGVEFVELKPGYFRMGSHFFCQEGGLVGRICVLLHLPWGKQPKHDSDECPPHWVEISGAYWIARSELTNAQYERFDSKHKRSQFSKEEHSPVAVLIFSDVEAYCDWLSKRSGLPVRLPSEAEWENACRAGSTTEYAFGDDPARLGEYAWFAANSGDRAHAVKTKRPNAWGLYDLHGNVWEWCEDTYHKDYKGAPEDATAWTEGGEVRNPDATQNRVYRGGAWHGQAILCRAANRAVDVGLRRGHLGFRPALGVRASKL